MTALFLALAMQTPVQPAGPVPTQRQLEWHKMQYYAFIHFGPNTFTGEEWGHGREDPKLFNPQQLDCRQWAKTFKDAGMEGIVITAKHHDGFCLWPSKFSTHTVAQSGWKDGKGDVLKELSEACKEYGLKMGVYLSPWDRNHPTYGTPEYNEVFKNMLREVLGNYGPIFEVWFDGANGEGPNGKRQVYDWPGFVQLVRELHPNAVIFSDAGPDIRWVGNEAGYANETSWNLLNRDEFVPGTSRHKELNTGHENGTHWLPPECDVSIRPGWFWRESENEKVKSVAQLMDIWYGSVGRGSNLLLNVPPDSRGLIHENDVARLLEFRRAREADFFKQRSLSGSGPAAQAVDAEEKTHWAAPAMPAELELSFGREVLFDRLVIREALPLGQRVKAFEVLARSGEEWKQVASATTIGNRRILVLEPTQASALRIRFTDAKAPPVITDVQAWASMACVDEED